MQEPRPSYSRLAALFGLGFIATFVPLAAYVGHDTSALFTQGPVTASTGARLAPSVTQTYYGSQREVARRGLLPVAAPKQSDGTALFAGAATVAVEKRQGLLPADRYIASNQFKVRPGSEAQFEARWAKRKSRLALLPGFRFFTLLRRIDPDGKTPYDDDYNYVSLTVWQDKDAFTAWRTGDAFKEAHGGTDIFSFFKMVTSSLLTTKGPPRPAFYEGLVPVAAPATPTPTVDGWRSVEANGVDTLPTECFVAMRRFTVEEGKEAEFEQRWAQRTSSLQGQPGFKGFWVSRADISLEDGSNYVAMTVWTDKDSFFKWRDANDPEGKEGPKPGVKPPMLMGWPKPVFYEGVLMLESQAGI